MTAMLIMTIVQRAPPVGAVSFLKHFQTLQQIRNGIICCPTACRSDRLVCKIANSLGNKKVDFGA